MKGGVSYCACERWCQVTVCERWCQGTVCRKCGVSYFVKCGWVVSGYLPRVTCGVTLPCEKRLGGVGLPTACNMWCDVTV